MSQQLIRFAMANNLRLGCTYGMNGKPDLYFVRDPYSLKIVETTRSAHPTIANAMAMMRRHLRQLDAAVAA